MRSQTMRLTHRPTKKIAPKETNSPTFTASSVDQTSCSWTDENQRLSV